MNTQYSKLDMQKELRTILWATADCLGRIYPMDASWHLLGLAPGAYRNGCIHDLEPEQIDMSKFSITKVMDKLYDYAFEAKWDINENWIDLVTDSAEFLEGLQNFKLLNETEIRYSLDKCLHTLWSSTARWCLDDDNAGAAEMLTSVDGGLMIGGFLTLRQITLLAQMDEKSVRNATNPKVKGHLKTFSRNGRTFVYKADAKEWLAQRRSFKPTEFYDSKSETELTKFEFQTPKELGEYLQKRRIKLNKSPTEIAAASNGSLGEDQLTLLEVGNFEYDHKQILVLASLLELDPKALARAALALKQRLERNELDEMLRHGPDWGSW
jgi:hypothetical protein